MGRVYPGQRPGRSRPVDREGDDLVDGLAAGGEHDQAVDTQGDAGAVGQTVLECGEKAPIGLGARQVPLPTQREVGLETTSLLDGVAELVVAVGELDALDIHLEPLGDRRVAHPDPGESALVGGEVEQEGRPVASEPGLDHARHDEAEASLAVETG